MSTDVASPTYTIRDLTSSDEDFEKICQIWQEVFTGYPIERERLRKILYQFPGRYCNYIHEQGFCLSYLNDGRHGKINAIAVLPAYRRKGVGTAFLKKAKTGLRDLARSDGEDLETLEIGSQPPRFWRQVPKSFPQSTRDFLLHSGFRVSTAPVKRDLFKDIRSEAVPLKILERVSQLNVKFVPFSPEMEEECFMKQRANFSWHKAYEFLAAHNQHHEAMVAIDTETNAQVGWTMMASHTAVISDIFAFLPLLPSGPKTGAISCVGVDPTVRGKGVGLALIVRALENMRERGVEGVFVDAVAIRGFYEKMGFETWTEYDGFDYVF